MSDLNLTVQEGSDVYLAITETPAVVSLTNPLVASASFSVTVGSSVSVSNFPAVTTVAGAVTVNNFPASQTVDGTVDLGNPQAISADFFDENGRIHVAVQTPVTVSNFPATQTIAGTVTARIGVNSNGPVYVLDSVLGADPNHLVAVGGYDASANELRMVGVDGSGRVTANLGDVAGIGGGDVPAKAVAIGFEDVNGGVFRLVDNSGWPLPVSGSVTASVVALGQDGPFPVEGNDQWGAIYAQIGNNVGGINSSNPLNITGTVTVGNSVTISSLPAISGTVTANLDSNNFNGALTSYVDAVSSHNAFPVEIAYQPSVTIGSLPAISGTVTARLVDSTGIGLTSTTVGSTARLNVTLASATTTGVSLPAVVNVNAGSDSGTVRAMAVDSSGRTLVGNIAGWNIPTHDFRSFAYTSGNLTQIAYKTGGASGTTVGILTLAYDGSGNLTSMTKS